MSVVAIKRTKKKKISSRNKSLSQSERNEIMLQFRLAGMSIEDETHYDNGGFNSPSGRNLDGYGMY
jgi:hypothetical protein